MRPKQWTKNLFIFAAAMFTRKLDDINILKSLGIGFFVFCMISGVIYIINDWMDKEKDKLHPEKRYRPIASGLLNSHFALVSSILIAVFSICLAWITLSRLTVYVIFSYLLINLLYSFWLKHIVIVDINNIAIGFVLRVLGGVVILKKFTPAIEASPWLLLCTYFLALFLAAAKRRHELLYIDSGVNHRKSLKDYSEELIDSILSVAASASIICYSLYTVFIEFAFPKLKSSPEPIHNLYFTVPLVVVAILRYKFLIFNRQEGGSPEKVLLTDRPLQLVIFIWVLMVVGLAYMQPYVQEME